MDALERLRQIGQVERVDQAVLDAALAELVVAIGGHAGYVPARRVAIGRRIAVTALVAALAAAAAYAAVAWPWPSIPATRPGPVRAGTAGPFSLAAVLTAFSASGDDILVVTKIVRGEGTCCKTIMWIAPARSAPGATVRTRIQTFTTNGFSLSDMALTYAAPAKAPVTGDAGCGAIFSRPSIVWPPARGIPGTLTMVSYPSHAWVKAKVGVQAATVPSAGPLRACLTAGQWRDVGRRELGGDKVIELVSSDGFVHLWVNASTFLPVRLVSNSPTPYGPTTITFAFRFLRPTAANEAALSSPPVPAGFSRQRIGG